MVFILSSRTKRNGNGGTRNFSILVIVVGLMCYAIGLFTDLNSNEFVSPTLFGMLQPGQAMPQSFDTTMPIPQDNKVKRTIVDDGVTPRPNWKVSLDCSIFSLDCPIRREYAPYPFDFWDDKFLKDSSEAMTENQQSHKQHPPESPGRPQPVSKQKEKKCMNYVKDTPFSQQLDNMLQQLSRSLNRLVAYTLSDIGYAKDMIHDVFAMAHNVVGFPDSFFMVAMDDATMELCCRYGYPILPCPHSGGLEDRVRLTKFQVSLDLLKNGQDFLFFEMDVWFIRPMLPFLQNQIGDFLCSSHQNNPEGMNIGVYAAKANNATLEYFQHCLDVARTYQIHDQQLMQELQVVSSRQQAGYEMNPRFPNVTFQYHVNFEFMGSHEIAASEWPRLTLETIAVHPLSWRPLTGSHGKMQVAKELSVFYGAHGYYSSEGRYLWLDRLDNSYSMVMQNAYHDGLAMKWTVSALIALAKRTNRIWVLPRIQADIGRHFLWAILDMKTVEELGVEVRETSFLHNRKLADFPSVCRTALGERRIFLQKDDEKTNMWQIKEEDQLDTWFSIIDNIESNALLVNPYVIDSGWPARFVGRENGAVMTSLAEKEILAVFNTLKWCDYSCKGLNSSCPVNFPLDWSHQFWDNQRLSGARASLDCYGEGLLTG